MVVGGGSGTSILLRGLRQRTQNLTAIVTMFDSGGSSGLLREEFGFPPFGDLRQCLIALASKGEPAASLAKIFDNRFGKNSTLRGHSVGNLVMAALAETGLDFAVQKMSSVLDITGKVVPVTKEDAHLKTELADGVILPTEAELDQRNTCNPSVKRIFLSQPVTANPDAIRVIADADAVVFGPGDLYTSILPNLLPEGMVEAVQKTRARLIYVCSLMTKLGETDGFSTVSFAEALSSYIGPRPVDNMIVNQKMPSRETLALYSKEGSAPVEDDSSDPDMKKYAKVINLGNFAAPQSLGEPLRHNSALLAEEIIAIVNKRG